MKKFICLALSLVFVMLIFSSCGHTHEFGPWEIRIKPTCEQDGLKVRVCDCEEEESEIIPMLGHNYKSEITKEANCNSTGKETFTCENCQDSYFEKIEAKVYSSTEIYEMYKGSVGEVHVYDKNGEPFALGSCFVYEKGNQIVTNYHVIEDALSADVTVDEKTYKVEKVLAYDKDIDIAVLQLSKADLEPAHICTEEHDVGSTVYTFGSSRGLTYTIADGMISSESRVIDGVKYVQHDAPMSNGNSGGPLINSYGEVIGVNTWFVGESQNLNFSVHVSEIENLKNNKPMTMAEFFKQESSVYNKLVDYALKNGKNNNGMYNAVLKKLTLTEYNSSVTWGVSYESGDGLYLTFIAEDLFTLAIVLDEDLSGTYQWMYLDRDDDYIAGNINGATYDGTKVLTYTEVDSKTGASAAEILKYASSFMATYCKGMRESFSSIGITPEELGFAKF